MPSAKEKPYRSLRFAPCGAGFSLTSLLPLLLCADALAFNFGTESGELTGSLDTTLSYGQMYRMEKQDKNNDDINTNDGNRNFSKGKLVTNAGSIVSTFKLSYGDYGLTLKGKATTTSRLPRTATTTLKTVQRPSQPKLTRTTVSPRKPVNCPVARSSCWMLMSMQAGIFSASRSS